VELIGVLIIISILAVAALPRFFQRESFDARVFYDQVQSMLRYGHKVAIAQRANVFFNANADTICLTYVADPNCSSTDGVIDPASHGVIDPANPNGAGFVKTVPANVTLSDPVSFCFTALGKPELAGTPADPCKPDPTAPNSYTPAPLRISGGDTTRTITVEPETGYVH
jgi:MSHA pilin protein MshC